MGKNRPPRTNTQRQQSFRKGHPGYFKKYYARKKSARLHALAQLKAVSIAQAEQAAAQAAVGASVAVPLTVAVPLALPCPTVRLALPAPVEVLEFPAMKTLEAIRVSASHRAAS